MCKEKKTAISAQFQIIQTEKIIFLITGWASCIFWGVLVVSVGCKITTQMGICSYIAGMFGYRLIPLAILNTDSILEVAKTIGIGSLFVAWIYAELGKSELGKPYTDLLKDFCRYYHFRTFSHIAAVLACIWLAMTGTIESSCLALGIVMIGLIDQAVVLTRFIFHSNIRKEIALEQWKRTFNFYGDSPNEELNISHSDFYTLEDAISVKDKYCEELCKCLAQAMLEYVRRQQGGVMVCSSKETIIMDISNIWENLFESRSENERSLLLYKIILQIENGCGQAGERILICAGYLMWLCRHYARKGKDRDESDGNVLLMILNDISQINHRIGSNDSDIAKSLDTLYVLLAWMHFLCNDIILCRELLESFMLHDSVRREYNREDKECFRAFALCMFDGDICGKYFDNAWKRIVELPHRKDNN